jgi:hypothetical protein
MNDIVFPQAVLDAYTGADSWIPAGRIAALTQWKAVALYPVGTTTMDEHFIHMAVKVPDGHIIDINGLHDENEFIAFYTNGRELEIHEIPDEHTYFLVTDPRKVTRTVRYPLTTVIRSMFEKYSPSLLYRLKTL